MINSYEYLCSGKTIRSYQGVHLPEAGLKENVYKYHWNLCAISYIRSYCVKIREQHFVIVRYVFDNDEVCNQRTIYRDSIEIVIILNSSLQHAWG